MKKKSLVFYFIVVIILINLNNGQEIKNKVVVVKNQTHFTQVDDQISHFKDANLKQCVKDVLEKGYVDSGQYTQKEINSYKQNGTITGDIKDKPNVTLADIEMLNCSAKRATSTGITDLTGLEKLTGLKILGLWEDGISSINLSAQTKLKGLSIGDNKITSIDLSKNTELTTLHIKNNKLSGIDLSKNTKLKEVNISGQSIASVDLSKNVDLENLDASGNGISSIDVSNNTKLQELNLYNNNISNIDVSKLTGLKGLSLSNNPISSLNLLNNKELNRLHLNYGSLTGVDVSNNTKLTELLLNGNSITSIDLSKNTDLETLSVSANQLKELNLQGLAKLKKLYASSNQLQSLSLNDQTNLIEINAIFNNFNGYNLSNKSKIETMTVENDWIQSLNFSEYSNLKKLSVNSHGIIPIYGTSVSLNEVRKYLPSNVTINKNTVSISDWKKISSSAACRYLIKYSFDNNTSTTPTATDYCNGTSSYDINDINGSLGSTTTITLYSNDVKISSIQVNATVDYTAYFSLRYMNLTSDKYKVDESNSTIDVGGDEDGTIRNNLKTSWNGVVYKINGDVLTLSYNDIDFKTFKLLRVTNPKTGSITLYVVIGIVLLGIVGSLIGYAKILKEKHNKI